MFSFSIWFIFTWLSVILLRSYICCCCLWTSSSSTSSVYECVKMRLKSPLFCVCRRRRRSRLLSFTSTSFECFFWPQTLNLSLLIFKRPTNCETVKLCYIGFVLFIWVRFHWPASLRKRRSTSVDLSHGNIFFWVKFSSRFSMKHSLQLNVVHFTVMQFRLLIFLTCCFSSNCWPWTEVWVSD